MADTLTIRLLGADRQPLDDPFDLDVADWKTQQVVARVRDHAGAVDVTLVQPTTMYRIAAFPLRHRPVVAHSVGGRSLDLYCPVQPSRVAEVQWPDEYPCDLTRVMACEEIGKLGPLPRAGLLNVFAKARAADVWRDVLAVTECRGDRIFAHVRADLRARLALSPSFVAVNGSLHPAPLGFERVGSWKERGVPYGGLQVTLFSDGDVDLVDLDIDDAGGLEHVFQVLGHALTNGTTHPYDIHQILTFRQGVDPGYRLVV